MNINDLHTLGIDIGSTTVKIAILNSDNEVLFSDYERHYANIQETLSDLLGRAIYKLGPIRVSPVITGSGGLTLAETFGSSFCPGGNRGLYRSAGLCSADGCGYRTGRRGCQDYLF